MGAIIRSVGTYSPDRVVTNDELAEVISASGGEETSDEWISKRTGITRRRIAEPHESNISMGFEATKVALDMLEGDVPPIEYILFATNTNESNFPDSSGGLQRELLRSQYKWRFVREVPFKDVPSGCAAINLALEEADLRVSSGQSRSVLVVGSDMLSSILDYSDRSTSVLFEDRASVYVLSGASIEAGFRGHSARGFGDLRHNIVCEEDQSKVDFYVGLSALEGCQNPIESRGKVIKINGREVYKFVEERWIELLEGFKYAGLSAEDIENLPESERFHAARHRRLNPDGVSFEDVAGIAPHLANYRNFLHLERRFPGFLEKCGFNSDAEMAEFCNSSTASQGRRVAGFLKEADPGSYLLMHGYGAGLISAANLYRKPLE